MLDVYVLIKTFYASHEWKEVHAMIGVSSVFTGQRGDMVESLYHGMKVQIREDEMVVKLGATYCRPLAPFAYSSRFLEGLDQLFSEILANRGGDFLERAKVDYFVIQLTMDDLEDKRNYSGESPTEINWKRKGGEPCKKVI